MRIIRDPEKLNRLLRKLTLSTRSIGFVPTMGALHPGHLSLIKQARRENQIVVVSIFVNPAQFGPKEDLRKYPRRFKDDLVLCRKAGVDLVFLPEAKVIYPQGFLTFVNVEKLNAIFCGASRPGHFRGVVTVVAKLLNIVAPSVLYLGQKDAQQVVIIKKMIRDLNFPVKVKVMPIVREKNGLAMSSRNLYLNAQAFDSARVLWQALKRAKALIKNGNRDYAGIILQMKKMIQEKGSIKVEYISIVDADSLALVNQASGRILVALAVKINKVRLIDNILVSRGSKLKG